MLAWPLSLLLLAVPALAAPNLPKVSGCSPISTASLKLPAGLTAPTTALTYVGLAFGTQNYTCNSTSSTYTSAGALADLFDISCLVANPTELARVEDQTYTIWKSLPPALTVPKLITALQNVMEPKVLGQHYFITNPITGTGLSPKWDFTSYKNDPNAFVVGAKTGDVPAPNTATDVDWLSLKNVLGNLANTVYRVDTHGGQPPTSCTAGSPLLTVKYTATYYFS